MEATSADRSLPPTPRRREAARRAGMIPGAAAPAWGASCLVTVLLLPRWLEGTLAAGADLFRDILPAALRGEPLLPYAAAVVVLARPTILLALAASAAGIAVQIAWDGLVWEPARVSFQVGRLAPWARLAQIASTDTLRQVLTTTVVLVALAGAAVWSLRTLLVGLAGDGASAAGGLEAAWQAAVAVTVAAALAAVVGFVFARRRAEARLWMTPEELAAEQRTLEAGKRVRFHLRGGGASHASGGR